MSTYVTEPEWCRYCKIIGRVFFLQVYGQNKKKRLWKKLQARFLQKESKTNILQYEPNELQ